MPTYISIGFSQAFNPEQAFNEAAVSLKHQLNQPVIDLVIALITPAYARTEGLQLLRRLLNPVRMIGSVTPAIIINERIESKGVALLGLTSSDIRFGMAAVDRVSLTSPRETAFRVAHYAESNLSVNQRYGSLFFLNSCSKNNSQISLGLQDGLGHSFVISGGIPCDQKLCDAPIIYNDKILTDSFAGLVWGGETRAAIAARHGWKVVGKPRMVTKAENNLIRTIDHQPAITIYQNYFKNDLSDPGNVSHLRLKELTNLYPIGVRTSDGKNFAPHHVVDALADGALVCQGEIPAGSCVHLMIGDKKSSRNAVRLAATELRDHLYNHTPQLVFVMESVSRRKLFGRERSTQTDIIKEILGLTVPVFGMYTYGEIAPLGQTKELPDTQPQSTSIVLTAIG